jgi:hypothetical protein
VEKGAIMSKVMIWDKDLKKYCHIDRHEGMVYNRKELRGFRDQIERMDKHTRYYKREDGMIVNADNEVMFIPKYAGEYPSILKKSYKIMGLG